VRVKGTDTLREATSSTVRTVGSKLVAAALAALIALTAVSAEAETARIAPDDEAVSHPINVHPELVSAEARAKSKLRRMLKQTGLDPEQIIPSVERALAAAGGPFMPYPTDPAEAARVEAEADQKFNSLVNVVEDGRLIEAAAVHIPFARPVLSDGRFSSRFGQRKDPENGRLAMHAGLDYAAPVGTAILSAAEGEVTFAGQQDGYGNMVQIRHEFGLETVYAHLNQIRVEVGQHVQRGERIGDMGSTGRSTGSHLHYEIRLNGTALDPMKFIEAGRDVYQEQDQRSDDS